MVAVSPDDLLWFVIVAGGVAMLTGWGIGANDVANSFGTSIGSGALTPRGALYIAAVFEFAGASLMGSHVTNAIRKGIVDQDAFVGDEGRVVFMVGMCSALLSSGLWLVLASRYGMPVSTTHSTVGAVIGFSIAATGYRSVQWARVAVILLTWVLSPVLAGCFSHLGYVTVRWRILSRDRRGELVLWWLPIMAGVAVAAVAMFVIYKGSPALGLDDTPFLVALLWSFVISAAFAVAIRFLVVPSLRKRMDAVLELSQEELFDFTQAETATPKQGGTVVLLPTRESMDRGVPCSTDASGLASSQAMLHDSDEDDNEGDDDATVGLMTDFPDDGDHDEGNVVEIVSAEHCGCDGDGSAAGSADDVADSLSVTTPMAPLKTATLTMAQRKYLARLTVNADVHDAEDRVRESVFAALQVFTASFEVFAHGANDVANAMGPFAAVVAAYNGPLGDSVDVPWWILALGGVSIVIGLGTYGYRVMDTIGKRIIEKITPSRGFPIELGTTLTVLLASRAGLPVSTTHASVGSVIAVGFADGRNAVSWSIVRSVALSWLLTVPAAAMLSASVFALLRPAILLQ